MGNRTNKRMSRQQRLAYSQQQKERVCAFTKTLNERKFKSSSWQQLIDGFYHRTISEEAVSQESSRQLFTLFGQFSAKKQTQRKFFYQMLLHLNQQKCYKLLQDSNYLTGLCSICQHPWAFIRPTKTWRRSSHSTERQFLSLLHHCFVVYEVPYFLHRVWLDADRQVQQRWFIDIASGKNIRHSDGLPMVMMKKMAHAFLQAPEGATVEEALRWAQVRGMGGSDRLANSIAGSRLGRNEFEAEAFWVTVIQFLLQQAEEFTEQVGEVIDYIANTYGQLPDFSMKGRTWSALLRQTTAWHEELNRERKLGGRFVWERSGIEELLLTEGSARKTKTYQMEELCSSKALAMEGRKMSHCVASYAQTCYKGRCAIFSLRVHDSSVAEETTLATIEVDMKQRRVVQAKARFNHAISYKAQQIMNKWATEQQLTVAPWLYN